MQKISLKNLTIFILIFIGACVSKTYAQTTSSLYLIPENFYSQMLNPAFMGNGDSTIMVSIPLLAGGTFGNSGNFKFTELLRKQEDGRMALDLEYFYNQGITTTKLIDWSSIPLLYVSVPINNGKLSFFIKDQIFTSFQFKTNAIEFFNNGNYHEEFRSYNTEEALVNASMYREFAVGYATKLSKNLSFGANVKILFGTVTADLQDWEYGIETSDRGDAVELSSRGKGKLSLPFDLEIVDGRIHQMYADNVAQKYFGSYKNPGLAIDLGMNYIIDEQSRFSFTLADLGGIWFRHNAYNIDQNTSYDFRGFDLTNSLDIDESDDFIDSYDLILNTKESIRDVYRPEADTSEFLTGLPAKTVLHYQYQISDIITLGVTNQTAFFKKNLFNTFSLSSKQIFRGFTFFENINLNKINNVSFGGGFQWEGSNLQLFFATDNFLALYHPADQKTFTLSFGICFMLNKQKTYKKGSFSPYLPFFERKKK